MNDTETVETSQTGRKRSGPRRPGRKARERLKARQAAYDALAPEEKRGRRRPGSLQK